MKKNSSFGMGMTYAGSFLGAGYVSGQELWQYFGKFGFFGFLGLVLTMLLFLFLGYVLFVIVDKTQISEMDKIIVLNQNKPLLILVSLLQVCNFISIYIIMNAGISALFESVFGLSKYYVGALSGIICVFLAIFGIKGLIRVFSFTIPILIISAVIISIYALMRSDNSFSFELKTEYSLIWILSSLVYMSFNFFGIIGIMAPIFNKNTNKNMVKKGIVVGTVSLFLIAGSIIFALKSNVAFVGEELPMLELSFELDAFIGFAYAVLLLLAMIGTSLSSIVAVDNFMCEKSLFYKNKRIIFLIFISAACYCFSLFGFGDLIAVLYPVFGTAGFFAIVMLVINYYKCRKI